MDQHEQLFKQEPLAEQVREQLSIEASKDAAMPAEARLQKERETELKKSVSEDLWRRLNTLKENVSAREFKDIEVPVSVEKPKHRWQLIQRFRYNRARKEAQIASIALRKKHLETATAMRTNIKRDIRHINRENKKIDRQNITAEELQQERDIVQEAGGNIFSENFKQYPFEEQKEKTREVLEKAAALMLERLDYVSTGVQDVESTNEFASYYIIIANRVSDEATRQRLYAMMDRGSEMLTRLKERRKIASIATGNVANRISSYRGFLSVREVMDEMKMEAQLMGQIYTENFRKFQAVIRESLGLSPDEFWAVYKECQKGELKEFQAKVKAKMEDEGISEADAENALIEEIKGTAAS